MNKSDWSGYARSLLRIVVGFLYTCHGVQKLFYVLAPPMPRPHMWSLNWIAGMIETVGGPLIALGLFTRPLAFLFCGEMAVAYFRVHLPRSPWPIKNSGETAVLFCFIFLYLFAAGAGPLSLDRWMLRKK